MSLLREDRRPLASRARDHIWQMIQQRGYAAGDRLPSEEQLATQLGVSRPTIREALRLLEEERLVICRHGVGRFVAPHGDNLVREEITRLLSVTEMARQLGITIETHVLSLHEEPADERIAAHLAIEAGTTVLRLERVRRSSGTPVIYSIDIVPRRLAPNHIEPAAFAGSLLALMEEQWSVNVAYSHATFSAVTLEPALSRIIGAPDGLPWIFMEHVNYNGDDRPVLYSRDYYRGDVYQFHVLRRRR